MSLIKGPSTWCLRVIVCNRDNCSFWLTDKCCNMRVLHILVSESNHRLSRGIGLCLDCKWFNISKRNVAGIQNIYLQNVWMCWAKLNERKLWKQRDIHIYTVHEFERYIRRIYYVNLVTNCWLFQLAAIHVRVPYYLPLKKLTHICRVLNHWCVDIIYAGISADLSRFFLENNSIHFTTSVFHS